MYIISSIKNLSKFEKTLWSFSLIVVTLSYLMNNNPSFLVLLASLIGVSALIFISKGDILGQILTVIFSILYAFISFETNYYGEMITYLCMTMPIAILSIISWAKNPYSNKEVKINILTPKKILILIISAILTTYIFYYILKYFNTANLGFSTISITTSFLAASLMMIRSPYYAICYGLNDIVLIILWTIAAVNNPSVIPMSACFSIFLLNDIYGLINWTKIKNKQSENL